MKRVKWKVMKGGRNGEYVDMVMDGVQVKGWRWNNV